MTSRHYRDSLIEAMKSADHDSIAQAVNAWDQSSMLLQQVSDNIRSHGTKITSQVKGQAGEAMVAKFLAISDKVALDAEGMLKGSEALGIATDAALQAIQVRNGIQLSGPMNQMPTKPEGPTPGTQPTTKQTQALASYNSGVAQYEANEAAAEAKARLALQQLDQQYAEAALLMKEIHGEPDPKDPAPSPGTPSGPAGSDAPVTPGSTPGPGAGPGPTSAPPVVHPDHGQLTLGPVHGTTQTPTTQTDPIQITQHPPITTTPPTIHDTDLGPDWAQQTPSTSDHPPSGVTTTNVQGQTDGGSSYNGVQTGSTSSGTVGTAGGTSAGVGGGAAAGMAGAGLGAGIKGGLTSSSSALKPGSVRGIGAGGRAGAPGSLGRSATTSGTARGTSAGARSAGAVRSAGSAGSSSASRSAGAGARAGAPGSSTTKGSTTKGAGTKGAGTKGASTKGGAGTGGSKTAGKGSGKGRGLFRRGSNGSTAGGRPGKKKDDEPGVESESLVYEQDWLGEDSPAPGVLD